MSERMRDWVLQEIEKGRAVVRPAGSHKVDQPMLSFSDRLNACRDIEELKGFANRRRYAPNLPKWNEEQRSAILRRKMEMQKQGMKK